MTDCCPLELSSQPKMRFTDRHLHARGLLLRRHPLRCFLRSARQGRAVPRRAAHVAPARSLCPLFSLLSPPSSLLFKSGTSLSRSTSPAWLNALRTPHLLPGILQGNLSKVSDERDNMSSTLSLSFSTFLESAVILDILSAVILDFLCLLCLSRVVSVIPRIALHHSPSPIILGSQFGVLCAVIWIMAAAAVGFGLTLQHGVHLAGPIVFQVSPVSPWSRPMTPVRSHHLPCPRFCRPSHAAPSECPPAADQRHRSSSAPSVPGTVSETVVGCQLASRVSRPLHN
mmetsp:Transcript_16896/g.46237  ORF Transcript_16896/g.46237 Transcript_16896/m.46237 type:complete len:285 (-) Transcript_16896:68-922(-)